MIYSIKRTLSQFFLTKWVIKILEPILVAFIIWIIGTFIVKPLEKSIANQLSYKGNLK